MNESEIRKIVQDEMQKNYRSGSPDVPPHRHNGIDNLPISQQDVTPTTRATGSITFSHTGQYVLTINANANPTLILCYGTVVSSGNTVRAHTMGSAQLGQSYYFQPLTSDSVQTGGPRQSFIQSSSYISIQDAGSPGFAASQPHALTDEGNLVDVEFGGTIHARMTLTGYTKSTITLNVSSLDSGWSIIVNLVVI